MANFEAYMQGKVSLEQVPRFSAKRLQKSRLLYCCIAVLGALAGGLVAKFWAGYYPSAVLSCLSIPFFTGLFLKVAMDFRKQAQAGV
ncbi:MAG: hypothetical protein EAY75_12700 [Bacteroidetes bacterium]|nr:MAG: hypothetical protein EAY75_12700 [Bacteroidota bacterium]